MAEYTWPTTRAFRPASMQWGMRRNARTATSSLSGWTQELEIPGSRWTLSIAIPAQVADDRRQVEGFLARLAGRANGVRMSRPGVSRPAGSINTSGVLAGSASAFATTLSLYACGATKTLLAGDMLGLATSTGTQLVQCVANNTSNGSSVMTGVEITPMLRGSVAGNSAVVLIQPTALFKLADPSSLAWPREAGGWCPGVTIDLVEAFA